MIDMSDPLERLRAVNPVPAAEVALLTPDRELFDRITSVPPVTVADPLHRRRRGRRLVPVLAVASLLGGAAAYGLLRRDVSRPETVVCFERADLTAAADAVRVFEATGPIEACAALWRRGVFGEGGEVPPLVECVLPSGLAGVFPATAGVDVCTAVTSVPPAPTPPAPTTTTPPATAPPADVNTRVLRFRDAVLAQFLDTPCMAPAAGVDIVRRELDRAGLGEWTIVSGGFSAERPCATLSLHSAERQVILVPSPPRR